MNNLIRFVVLVCFLSSCSSNKKMTTPGFMPTEEEVTEWVLSNRSNSDLGKILIVSPQSDYPSWRRMIYLNPDVDTYLLRPGDYREWGVLRPSLSGTSSMPKQILRYDDRNNDVHPVSLVRDGGDEVIIEGFNFNNISHWKLQGITVRGISAIRDGKIGGPSNLISYGSNSIVLEQCLIEEVLAYNAIRITSSSYSIINNCVIRNKVHGFKGDNIAISISAAVNTVSKDTKIISNEIYNYTDGVQLVYHDTPSRNSPITGEVPGTLIENNDIYITKKLHTHSGSQACAENAVDIKVGTTSTNPKDWIRVTGNRMWGYRKSDKTCSGSANGDAVTIHINARNIIVDNNIIFDSARAITVGGSDAKNQLRKIQNIAILNNLIFDLYDTASDNVSIAFITAADVDFYGNSVKGCSKVLGNNSASNHLKFDCNTFIDIKLNSDYQFVQSSSRSNNAWINYGQKTSKWNPKSRNHYSANRIDSKLFKDFTFTRKIITNPERVIVESVVFSKPVIPTTASGGCEVKNLTDSWWHILYD